MEVCAPASPLGRIATLGGGVFFLAAALQQTGLMTASVTNSGFLTALYVVFTPLATFWYAGVSGLSADLAAFAVLPGRVVEEIGRAHV